MARILIAEDDDSVRAFVARALAMDGHGVFEAADGEQGLAMLPGAQPDLLLSDIRMPGMDGIELAKAAHSALPGLPVLLMTGYADQRERAVDLEGVVIDVVQKPFTLAQIRQAVQTALTGSGIAR